MKRKELTLDYVVQVRVDNEKMQTLNLIAYLEDTKVATLVRNELSSKIPKKENENNGTNQI